MAQSAPHAQRSGRRRMARWRTWLNEDGWRRGGLLQSFGLVPMSVDPHHLAVQRAMRAVPREQFLPVPERRHAHHDTALPIACGQAISQPSLVAYMTEQLALTPASRVLEIGTGSGFQAAVLAELVCEVFTVERIAELAREAETRLGSLGYRNI